MKNKKKTVYHRLSFRERESISRWLTLGMSIRQISIKLGRDHGAINREISHNGGRRNYRALLAERCAKRRREKQGRRPKLTLNQRLAKHVLQKLFLFWSPEQIANQLKIDYPKDVSMRASPETIYRYVYIQPKGELKKLLTRALRRHHYKRYRRNRRTKREVINIPNLVSIDSRPKEVNKRTIPGHWEGDLILGRRQQSGLGTIVERLSRKVILVPLEEKNHLTVAKNFSQALNRIPKKLRQTLTYDRGGEMSSHETIAKKTKIKIYFAHGKSPWERGTSENTNGLIRQFFPKGTDFNKVSIREIKRAERLLNQRPRKTLGWKTPEEVFKKVVQ